MMRSSLAWIIPAVLLAACGTPEARKTAARADEVTVDTADLPASQAPKLVMASDKDCPATGSDSAQAVCVATHLRRAGEPPRRVFEVVRRGETICVHTGPGEPAGTDDEARVSVVRGRMVTIVQADSTGCR